MNLREVTALVMAYEAADPAMRKRVLELVPRLEECLSEATARELKEEEPPFEIQMQAAEYLRVAIASGQRAFDLSLRQFIVLEGWGVNIEVRDGIAHVYRTKLLD